MRLPCGSLAAGADGEVQRWIRRHEESLIDESGLLRFNTRKAMELAAMFVAKGDTNLGGAPAVTMSLRSLDDAGQEVGPEIPQPAAPAMRLGISCPNRKCRRSWTLRADTFRQIVLRASLAGLRRVPLP